MNMNAYQLHLDERQKKSKDEQNEKNLRRLQQAVPKTVMVKLTPASQGSGTKWTPNESGWIPTLTASRAARENLTVLMEGMRESARGDRGPVAIDPNDL